MRQMNPFTAAILICVTRHWERPIITITGARQQTKGEKAEDKYGEYAVGVSDFTVSSMFANVVFKMVLRRIINVDGQRGQTRLEVRSQHIRNALRKVLGDYPGLSLNSVPTFIEKPYSALYHFRNELREFAEKSTSTEEE